MHADAHLTRTEQKSKYINVIRTKNCDTKKYMGAKLKMQRNFI